MERLAGTELGAALRSGGKNIKEGYSDELDPFIWGQPAPGILRDSQCLRQRNPLNWI